MSYGKPMSKNFYTQGRGEIAMPEIGEVPPVLADSPQDWAGSKQEAVVAPEPVQQQEESNELEESDVVDTIDTQDVEQEEEAPAPKAKNNQDNFRNLREARERAEWERDTLKAQIEQMQRSGNRSEPVKQEVQQEEPDDFDFQIEDDALLEGKHAKKLVQELKKVKKELRSYHSQTSETAVEAKIKSNFPDFTDVVSQQNVARLNSEFPEIAQTLRDTPDIYNKAAAAYSIMKRFGIYKDTSYDEDKMKAVKNAQKPRPVASVSPQQGDSPLSKANAFANGLNKELQKKLLEEMNAARRNM